MNNRLASLKKIKTIVEINDVNLASNFKDRLNTWEIKIAKINTKQIFAYKIIYKSQGHNVTGYIVEPVQGNNLPCIVWNRGGFQEFGAIKEKDLFIGSIAEFAKAGYIVIASQYSGNAGGQGKDEHGGSDVNDVLNLYKILKQYSRADISRIGMYGGSRGGMMNFLALPKAKWVKAVVTIAPLTNLFSAVKNRPELTTLYKSMFGGGLEAYKKRSAFFLTDQLPKHIPILLMHGTADWRVDVADTLDFAKKLYLEKIPYKMVIYEGDDHHLTKHYKTVILNSIDWFDRFVKNKEKTPNLNFDKAHN